MNARQDAGQGTTASDSVLSLRALYDAVHHETQAIDGTRNNKRGKPNNKTKATGKRINTERGTPSKRVKRNNARVISSVP